MNSISVDGRWPGDALVPEARTTHEPATAAASREPRRPGSDRRRIGWSSFPFFVVHASPLLVILTGLSPRSLVLLATTFWARMFCITAGYHRYFAHRSYRMRRVPQFLMALAGTSAMQKGPLWWAAHHRDHHRLADRPGDLHSPLDGFWSSHLLWFMRDENARTRTERVPDLVICPELRFLDRHDMIGPVLLAGLCYLVDGWRGVVVGFLASTVLLWHATFTINSLAHLMGRRRYATNDSSRNSFILAVLTMGEGWHNNHHYRPSSCRNGFYWWEWDPTYYLIRALELAGVVRDVRTVPKPARARQRIDAGAFDVGMFSYRISQASHNVRADAAPDLPRRAAMGAVGAAPSSRARLEDLVVELREAAAVIARDQRRAGPDTTSTVADDPSAVATAYTSRPAPSARAGADGGGPGRGTQRIGRSIDAHPRGRAGLEGHMPHRRLRRRRRRLR